MVIAAVVIVSTIRVVRAKFAHKSEVGATQLTADNGKERKCPSGVCVLFFEIPARRPPTDRPDCEIIPCDRRHVAVFVRACILGSRQTDVAS